MAGQPQGNMMPPESMAPTVTPDAGAGAMTGAESSDAVKQSLNVAAQAAIEAAEGAALANLPPETIQKIELGAATLAEALEELSAPPVAGPDAMAPAGVPAAAPIV